MFLQSDDSDSAMVFTEEQGMLLDSARAFCRDNSPIEAVREQLNSPAGYNQNTWKEMVDLGWLAIAVPEEFDGVGLGIGGVVPVAESMGRSMLSTPFLSTTLAAQAILRAGSEQQKQHWLPKIMTGTKGTLALLENGDWGSNEISCSATDEGEQLVLSGKKQLVDYASCADVFVVLVKYQNEPALVIVERDELGDKNVQPHTLIDETKRAGVVDLSGVMIQKSSLLQHDDIASVVKDLTLMGALLVAAEATGSAAAALDLTVEYLKTRKQFGKLIGSYQALKHPAVDMLNEMESARSHTYHAATLLDDAATAGQLTSEIEIACRMAKAQATEALLFAGDRSVQFHGGMGFTYECDAQLYIRRAQWSQQQYGDAYHHRKRLADLLLTA